jgi:DNA ligase-associated metallophosphoesterase
VSRETGDTRVLERCGEHVELRPDGSVYLSQRAALLIADLHLGKAEGFAASGIAAPAGTLEADLSRLEGAVGETGCGTVYVLGDVLHHRRGVMARTLERVGDWRERAGVAVVAVRGNHDALLSDLAPGLGIVEAGEFVDVGPFRLRHRAVEGGAAGGAGASACLQIVGHLHPVVRLRTGGDDVRLRCFVEEDGVLTLPAWSSFAGGSKVAPAPRRGVFALADGQIIDLGTGSA